MPKALSHSCSIALQERLVAVLEVQVGDSRGEIELAHGMPDRLGRLADRQVVLEVLRAESPAGRMPRPRRSICGSRSAQVGPLAGVAVELDQRGLDLGVAVEERPAAIAEGADDQVGEPRAIARKGRRGRRGAGHRGLDQVAGAVELVALLGWLKALGGQALHVGVEVAVRLLDLLEQLRQFGQHGIQRPSPARPVSQPIASSVL